MKQSDRLLEVIKDRYGTQVAFADELGVSRQSLNSVMVRGSFSMDFLLRLHKFIPDLNMNWLISGKGDRYIRDNLEDGFVGEPAGTYNIYSADLVKDLRDQVSHLRGQLSFMQKLLTDLSESRQRPSEGAK